MRSGLSSRVTLTLTIRKLDSLKGQNTRCLGTLIRLIDNEFAPGRRFGVSTVMPRGNRVRTYLHPGHGTLGLQIVCKRNVKAFSPREPYRRLETCIEYEGPAKIFFYCMSLIV